MKKIFYILLITQLTIGLSYSQSGWFWVNPYPTGNIINCVKFINKQTGYVATGGGSIMKTTNSGNNWIIQKADNEADFNSLCFVDSNTGYAAGTYSNYYSSPAGFVYRTTNGGRYWGKIYSDTSFVINTIQFINKDVGFADSLMKTTNGGYNWFKLPVDTGFKISSYYFINENTGFAGGYYDSVNRGWIQKTTDGGNSWLKISLGYNSHLFLIQFINESTGYIAANRLLKTTDGGLNWFVIYAQMPRVVYFLNANTGYFTLSSNYFAKTTNGGINWVVHNLPTIVFSTTLYFSDHNTGFIGSVDGTIFKTTNSGINWLNLKAEVTHNDLFSLHSLNDDTVFIAGYYTILKSVDKGKSWDVKNFTDGYFTTIKFFNQQTGIAAGDYGPIYRTTDGGNNWYLNASGMGFIWKMHFPDEQTGYGAGRWNNLIKTTNAGLTWVNMNLPTNSDHHQSVFFTNVNTGYTVSEYGKIHKTTNGGQTLQVVYTPQSATYLYSVFFTSKDTGYAAGGTSYYTGSLIFKTTNAGLNWNRTLIEEEGSIQCISFYNSSLGYAVGYGGTILRTTNSGSNWVLQPSGTYMALYTVLCLDSLNIITAGMDGTILKTTNGGISIEEKPPEKIIPENYRLYQNYPNPFNPLTTIKFDLASGFQGNVKLTVYDILGRVVSVIVNENMEAGVYQFTWNGSNFASGIYFYRLETDPSTSSGQGFSQTKKMVLLK